MRNNVYFAAMRIALGGRSWPSISYREVTDAIERICGAPETVGLRGRQFVALSNSAYAVRRSISTRRMPVDLVAVWDRMTTLARVRLMCEIAETHGQQSVESIYRQWAKRLAAITQAEAAR